MVGRVVSMEGAWLYDALQKPIGQTTFRFPDSRYTGKEKEIQRGVLDNFALALVWIYDGKGFRSPTLRGPRPGFRFADLEKTSKSFLNLYGYVGK